MAPGIAYDDSGSLASYFGVTVLAFILIPSTYYTLLPSKRNAPKPLAPYPAHIQQTHPSAQTSRSGSSKLKRVALLALGYAVLAFLCFRIINAPPSTGGTVYNPFEILGLSDRSTEKQIKKHYKKLSLQLWVHATSALLTIATRTRSSSRRTRRKKTPRLSLST